MLVLSFDDEYIHRDKVLFCVRFEIWEWDEIWHLEVTDVQYCRVGCVNRNKSPGAHLEIYLW